VNIKILGSGCANCNKLEALTKEVIAELGVEAQIDHVKDFKAIAAFGVMTTPGLVIDGKVRSAGRIPAKAEIISWVTTALSVG
jgi:small redox-active disulfide protein 2